MKRTCHHLAIAAILMFSTLFATAQKPQNPLELNNYFASITDSLYRYGVSWGSQFQKARQSQNFLSLTAHRIKMEEYINNKFQELVVMKDISGSEKLRAAVIDFLAYERRIIKQGFVPFEKFTKTTSEEDIQKAINALVAASADESAVLKAITDEQVAYGKKNGFEIEKNEE